jgi:hypothetical protein
MSARCNIKVVVFIDGKRADKVYPLPIGITLDKATDVINKLLSKHNFEGDPMAYIKGSRNEMLIDGDMELRDEEYEFCYTKMRSASSTASYSDISAPSPPMSKMSSLHGGSTPGAWKRASTSLPVSSGKVLTSNKKMKISSGWFTS